MSQNLKLYIEFAAKSGPLVDALKKNSREVKSWASNAKREVDSILNSYRGLQSMLAGAGLGFGMYSVISASAKLDKSLIRVRQTAGATKDETSLLRKELFSLGAYTGQGITDLVGGVNSLVASGQSMKEARATITGIGQAMAISGANATTLSNALTVAGTTFDFDLSKPEMATLLLDKMAVAGRLGNAELEDLSGIFGRIGDNASSAGMSFDKTLAFVEVLSKVEKNPERLATLADSTLRMFTNSQYAKKIQSGTGIKFFDGNEARRDAFDVLNDIKANYDKLKTDEDRQSFIARILKGADLDTIKGMRTLLKGDLLSSADKFTRSINNASGTMKRDMQDAMDNAVDQAGRLKAILGKVGDDFSRPINKFLAKSISYTTNSKENGGLGLSGADLVGGAAVAGLSTWLISSILKRKGGGVGKAAGGLGGLLASKGAIGANIAEGKIYEQMGVQSVFVVNMPNSLTNGEGLLGGAGAGAAGGLGQVGVGAAAKGMWKYGTTFTGSGIAGFAGKSVLGKIGAFAGPIGIAAATTIAIEQILAHGTNFLSGGKYKNYAEIFFGDSVARANQGVKPVDPNSPEGLELRRQTREKNEQQQINNNITAQVFIDGKQINAEKTNITERRGSLK